MEELPRKLGGLMIEMHREKYLSNANDLLAEVCADVSWHLTTA